LAPYKRESLNVAWNVGDYKHDSTAVQVFPIPSVFSPKLMMTQSNLSHNV